MTIEMKQPLDILNYRLSHNDFIVVDPAEPGRGLGGWRIASECITLESARKDAKQLPGSRIYQKHGQTFKRVAKR